MTKRDNRIDCIKGIAISLVVLGHILQSCFAEHSNMFIFNVIWSVQIPLFMVISGYLSKNRGINLLPTIGKKAVGYLVPFVSCFIIGVLVFNRSGGDFIPALKKLAFVLEDSLWYLFVLFILSAIHLLSCTVANKLMPEKQNTLSGTVLYGVVFGVLLLPWAAFAVLFGTTFLGAKFVLYYSFYFLLGQACKRLGEHLLSLFGKHKEAILDVLAALSVIVFFVINMKFSPSTAPDTIVNIAVRVVASLTGCFAVIRLVWHFYSESKAFAYLAYLGKYSLEIYYVHYLIYWYLAPTTAKLLSLEGGLTLTVYYFILIGISLLVTKTVQASKLLNLVIFGKR